MTKTGIRRIIIALSTLWLLTVCVGFCLLLSYQNSAGPSGVPPLQWPANSHIQPAGGTTTLVMLVHPHCPCTRASIGELALLMARCQGRLSAYVLFTTPREFPEGWERTDLWDSAERIPGVVALSDEGGAEAGRFNAETSGTTMLYDGEGRLLFNGGITDSRGHSGDNEGRSAIVALVTEQENRRAETPVYGCPLVENDRSCNKEDRKCSQ